MSKGLGPTERFVLDQIEGKGHVDVGPVSRGDEWELWGLAHLYARARGVEYTDDVVRSVRRAVRSLERKRLIVTRTVYPRAEDEVRRVRERRRKVLTVRRAGFRPTDHTFQAVVVPPSRH